MRIVIKTPLMTLNEYINLERGNRYAAAARKKALTTAVAWEARSQTRERLEGLYDVSVYWLVSGRHDPDNIFFGIKFILDGLVTSATLPNDDPSTIRHISHFYRRSKVGMVIVRLKLVRSPMQQKTPKKGVK
jgi:hypothetical protein